MSRKQNASQSSKPAQGPNPAVVKAAYVEAFTKHYPNYRVEFKPTKGDKYFVLINGDNGGLPMDLSDLQEATRNFLH